MEETPRFAFDESGHKSWNSYRFFPDRIELEWKGPFRSGKEVYSVSDITGGFGEQETFAFGIRSLMQSCALYLLLAVVLQLGFDHEFLRLLAYILYGLAAVALGYAVSKMKKEKWLYVKRRDGSTLFCVRVNGLKKISSEDFKREIARYSEEANKAVDSTPVSAPRNPGGLSEG